MRQVCISFAAGVGISLLISWLTVWVYVRSEYVSSQWWASYTRYAFGEGPDDNRWRIDIEEYSFGVYVCTLASWGGLFDKFGLSDRDRSGPDSVPYWSRARSDASGFPIGHNVIEVAAGFPFTSWKGEWRTLVDMNGTLVIDQKWFALSIIDPHVNRYPILLPLLPIFPGGIYNTIFWGTVFYVLGPYPKRAVLLLVRHRRRRRGLCPHCAYDITGLTTCPECGQSVAAKA